MDQEVLQDLYNRAVSKGYGKSIEEFSTLISSDQEVLQDSYNYVKEKGYQKPIEDFEVLVGVKKKDASEDMVLPLEDGSSVQLTATPTPESTLLDTPDFDTDPNIIREVPVQSGTQGANTLEEPIPEGEITPDKMGRNEEYLIPELIYQYEDQGFSFEKADPFGDEIKVTADNKKTLNVEVDMFFGNKAAEAKKLNDFIEANKIQSQKIKSIEEGYQANKIKFQTDEEIKLVLSQINQEADNFSVEIKTYLNDKSALDEERLAIDAMTVEQRIANTDYIKEYNQRYKALNKQLNILAKTEEGFKKRQDRLNQSIGEYYDMRAQQGSYSSAIPRQFASGQGRIDAGEVDLVSQLFISSSSNAGMGPNAYRIEFIKRAIEKGQEVTEEVYKMSPEELRNYFSNVSRIEDVTTQSTTGKTIKLDEKEITFGEDIEAEVFDYAKKYFKGEVDGEGLNMIEDIRTGPIKALKGLDVTEQWIKAKQEGFWGGAILGLAESIPAMTAGFGGNWGKATADMMALTSDFLDEEMSNNPEFDNISENEKNAFKLPVAMVSAVLETYGFRSVLKNTGLRNSILMKILGKSKKDLTGVPFETLVRNEVNSRLKKGSLRLVGGSLVEFETGAAQQIVEIGAKEIFNAVKEKDLFQTPESFSEGLGQVLRSGAQEAVGGFIMSVPGAIASGVQQKDFTAIDNNLYEIFRNIRDDSKFRTAFVQKIKGQIATGELTKEEGEKQLSDYNTVIGVLSKIPNDLSIEQEKAILGLQLRKQELENSTENKDKVLVKKELEEIADIDVKMEAILTEKETQNLKETIKEEAPVTDETAAPLKTKVEKEQAVDIESFFGEEVEETTETVTDNLSINRGKKKVTKSAKVLGTENTIIKIAQRGAKAISKLLPKTRIILHETREEFEKFAAPGRAEYDTSADVIHVNLEQASITTVPHEIFHAVFLNKVKTDPAAAKLAETMVKSVRKALPATSELAIRIDKFADKYKDKPNIQNEERLAELIGIMASEDGYRKLSKPNKNKVVKFIENLARQLGLDLKISEFTKTDEDVIDLLNTLAGKVATGEELVEGDVQTLEELDNGTNPIGSPTEIRIPSPRQQIDFKESYTLSLITPDKSMDLISLIEEIKSKDEKVWFWVADQLGSGIYNGVTLDAGPSFPYGSVKVNEDAVWATSISEKDIQNKLKDADYIFIMSGSPQQSKLFNKKVYDVFTKKLNDYSTFKQQALETKPTKALREVLEAHDSWESLKEDSSVNRAANAKKGIKGKIGTGRKKFLQALISTEKTKTTAFHKLIQSLDGYVSVEELRDGFYKENDFKQNDIMLVLKPTGYSLESNHSTYDKEILGEVIGVPDVKVDAFDVMPQEIADKYAGKPRTELSQAIAPFGSGIRKVTPERLKRQQRDTEEYISEGRDAGFKDTVIVDYLSRVRKVPMKEIKSAMEIVSEGLGALPSSFKNIDGGAKAGLKLFKRIDKNVIKPENNKKKQLAQSQILEKAIEYMQRQPEYKNEADAYKVSGETKFRKGLSTQQMLMEIDLQKTLGLRPTQDMSRKLSIARVAVRQRIKGIKDVQKVKTELKNFMRKSLPARVLLSKDAQRMFRYIERVTPDFMQSTKTQGAKIDNVFKEITSFVAEENNKILNEQIESILEGVYLKVISNKVVPRKIDYKTQEKIEVIKAMLPAKGMTPEQINEVQSKLNEEFNKLAKEIAGEENPDESILDRMTELQIAISYANALVQSNSDPIKTETLDNIYSQLQSLIEIGSSNLKLQIKNQAKEYRAQMAAMFYDITGVKLDPEDKNFKKSLKELENKRYTEIETREKQNRIKSAVKNVFRKLENTLFGTAEALTGLMNRISVLPGEMMGGISQTLVTEKINASSIRYKKRMLAFDLMFQDKLKEYYGKTWKKKARLFRKSTETYKIAEDRGKYNNLTQDQMYYLYNQYKDSASHPAFKNMFGEDYIKIMENLTKQLKPEVRKFADWQVNEYFPMVYAHYNEVYKDIYRTNMPQNQNYAGRIYRANTTPAPMNILGNSSTYNTQVSAASIMLREDSNAEIQPINGTDALVGYTREMEYFAAYAREVRDISKLFGNPTISTAIKQIHGQDIHGYITEIIEKISGQGMKYSIFDGLINKMTTVFVLARIGLSPLITIKQLTSALTYSNDIGVGNWLKYSAKNLPELRKVFKEISENSVYMRDRGSKTILSQIETYANTNSPIATDWIPDRFTDYLMNVVMYSTRLGDRGAIYLGGSANYSYYKDQFKKKNPGATEQQAIDYAIKKFERDTKETQQSSDLQDKDVTQNSGALARSLNMFMTTPKQYLRKEIIASRNLYRKAAAWDKKAGKGTLTENFRQLVTYHAFMPMFFQWVSSGFPISDWDDEDTSDMMRALIVGNLNALFITGDLIKTGADYLQGKPWYKETTSLPLFTTFTNIIFKYDKYDKETNPIKKDKKLEDFWVEFLMLTGLPAKNLQKFVENYPKLSQSKDFPEFMLRLLNYSKYQIEGRPKKGGGRKKKSMSMTEMKKFYPEMYEEIKGMEDPELKQFEKDMRELEKEMLESMYE
tara:strand:+ start:670 stop:8304 length:7635 start_codon:yes stop_codon:yes gene_type:complete